jgi:hypothetical protein
VIKKKHVTVRTAQLNKCWYDSICFVLLSIIVVLTAPFESMLRHTTGCILWKFLVASLKLCDTWYYLKCCNFLFFYHFPKIWQFSITYAAECIYIIYFSKKGLIVIWHLSDGLFVVKFATQLLNITVRLVQAFSGIHFPTVLARSRDSAVSIATGYELDNRGVGVRVQVVSRIFSSPRHPHQLWGPPSFLSNGYWGLFPQGGGVKVAGPWSWPLISN